jgi:formate dehydrogenase major subunit
MFSLNLFSRPQTCREPFSPRSVAKTSRLRGATVTESVCPYCAVGCGQLIFTKGGEIVDIEGNPESPVNEGTLCPKGANAFQLAVKPHRVIKVVVFAEIAALEETGIDA